MAVHPEINSEAFALTMDKYRIYIAKLNEFRKEENKKIAKHNISCPLVQDDEVKQTFASLFVKKHNSLFSGGTADEGQDQDYLLVLNYNTKLSYHRRLGDR